MWKAGSLRALKLLDDNKQVIQNISLLAPPADSQLIDPMMVSGRWLRADDVRSLAISEGVLKYYPNLKPGDSLNLKIDGKEEVWQVIGIFKFMDREGVLGYAPFEYIAQINGLVNRSASFRLVTDRHDRPYQDAKAEELDKTLRDLGYKVRLSEAGRASLDKANESLDVLVTFLLIMAVLTAIVGSMGLTGTMSMNVLERTREIGIMRAIGADDRAVMRTVIAEGVFVGTTLLRAGSHPFYSIYLFAFGYCKSGGVSDTDPCCFHIHGVCHLAWTRSGFIRSGKYFAGAQCRPADDP